jgi:outer membrane protein TolC
MKFYEKQVAAYDISLKGTQEELGVGTKILLDVLERQTDLLNAQLSLIDSKKNVLLEQFKTLAILGRLTPKMLKLKASVESPKDHYDKLVAS